jgi:hypothetical protein
VAWRDGSSKLSDDFMLTRLRAAALIVSVTVVTGYTSQSSPVNRPWPPGVQKVSNESPVLTPDEALTTFFMPPGYRVELVASEPLIHDPTAVDWDPQGRLWVVEMTGFVRDLIAPARRSWAGQDCARRDRGTHQAVDA